MAPTAPGSAPSPQSEAVTNELQELSLQAGPTLLPLRERKNVLQLKLQQRRTREELVSQGIMPPLKSPAAFHEQRRSLERARTEDYLKRKIRSRPERSELVRMHILEETSAEPSLQAKQLQLKRARLADDLNDKISHRPGPMELIHKNILPVHCTLKQTLLADTDCLKGTGESSSLDEDSSDALSPEQSASQDSPLGLMALNSPPDTLAHGGSDPSPTQFLCQALPLQPHITPEPSPPQKLTNGTATPAATRHTSALVKQSQSKCGTERPSQRSKKLKDSKPKVKMLKYHQYIPPDQKVDREPQPQLDSAYAKILHQQQLFLQLQILSQQQQQHYNYHTILPAPPKPLSDQQPASTAAPTQTRNGPASAPTSSNQNGPNRQSQLPGVGAKAGVLPANLDDLKVAELKHELKLRGLPVSGTKNDLIERLRNHQEQGATKNNTHQQLSQLSSLYQSGDTGVIATPFPLAAAKGAPASTMHFGSTSSSPPMSPTPSERSLAAMSPDEASCNGDVFGEAVSTPLTQLSLHTSPQHPTSVKEENQGSAPGPCRFSRHVPAQEPSPLDKDQMLQEKDKQIKELTRMLRQKQRLVESLRSQLEQGKRGSEAAAAVKEEPPETAPQEGRDRLEADVGQMINVKMEETVMNPQQKRLSPTQQLDQQEMQQTAAPRTLQVSPVLVNQQSSSPAPTPSFSLDLLKMNPPPTLLTDGNGNHYLIAVTSRTTPQSKVNGRIMFQRLQSMPCKTSSQSPPPVGTDIQPEESEKQPGIQPLRKGQKTGLQLPTNSHTVSLSLSAPPKLQPFFVNKSPSPSPKAAPSSPSSKGNVCSGVNQNTLSSTFSAAKQLPHSPSAAQEKESGLSSQQMDDLFDILIQSGELSAGFRADPNSCLSELHPHTAPPSPSLSPLCFSPTALREPAASEPPTGVPQCPDRAGYGPCAGSGRLEDFLESTTGKPLLAAEPDGPLTLIDDLHSQMLSTSSILDHPPSPMDTCELSFGAHPPGLDFADPTLDTMDWLDIPVDGVGGGTGPTLAPLSSHTPPSVFSADFLDSSDLQLHWDSCL
ncbi:myocardin-related transcription factor A-like isoform X3 [Scleropages formosus]|uniref:Myocardin related transcription factor A n=1 Tax=Scleropages formosus TaxID=113540 RepID=A0A8C9R0Y4_SCLFO|nr:myocardin-related transcription factor A-like isoform X3 [Scleropages formosus]